jgi:hypothetical protein
MTIIWLTLGLGILQAYLIFYDSKIDSKSRKKKWMMWGTFAITVIILIINGVEKLIESSKGKLMPTYEITSYVYRETPLNTDLRVYFPDSIEYAVRIDITLRNNSSKFNLMDVQAYLTYPNDYNFHKLRKLTGKFTLDEFNDHYRINENSSFTLGALPSNVGKQAFSIKLPAINKTFELKLIVICDNGYYTATIYLSPVRDYKFPDNLEINYALKIDSTKVECDPRVLFPKFKFESKIIATNPTDLEIKIDRSKWGNKHYSDSLNNAYDK